MRVAATASGSEVGDVVALWMGRLFIHEQTINENREAITERGTQPEMLSSRNRSSANRLRRKQALMDSDWNPNHKYIQQCPECNAVHETQKQNDEYCIECKERKRSAGYPAA